MKPAALGERQEMFHESLPFIREINLAPSRVRTRKLFNSAQGEKKKKNSAT